LPCAAATVADGARVLPEERTDRHHAGAHDQLLQLAVEEVELALGLLQFVEVVFRRQQLLHASAGDGDLAGEIEHAVEALGRDAHGAGGGAGGQRQECLGYINGRGLTIRAQRGHQLMVVVGERVAAAEETAEGVDAGEEERDEGVIDVDFVVVDPLQHLLVGVGKRGEGLEAEARRVPLQRVGVAEQVAAQLRVLRRVLERQESVLQRRDLVDRFVGEGGQKLVLIQIKFRHMSPSSVLKRSFRPRSPPTSVCAMSMPRRERKSMARSIFF